MYQLQNVHYITIEGEHDDQAAKLTIGQEYFSTYQSEEGGRVMPFRLPKKCRTYFANITGHDEIKLDTLFDGYYLAALVGLAQETK